MRLVAHPVLCNYYLTYRCNARCHFCDIWEKPSPYITLNDYLDNLRSLKKLGVKVIDFTGGEPLLHRELPEMLQLAKSSGFITTVTTNGLLYPKFAERMRGLVDMLHFSLDYFDREKHDQARGVACYDHVMKSIDLALSLGERPDILMTVGDENLDQIDPLYRHLTLPKNLMLILNPMFTYNQVGSGLASTSLDILEKWGRRKNIYLNQGFIQLRRDGGNKTSSPICRAASTTVVISPENELVLPCYHLSEKKYKINADLDKLYLSNRVQEKVKMEGKYAACEGCEINCYMQPSFATHLSRYWFKALPSTLKYNAAKGTWKNLFFQPKSTSKSSTFSVN